MSYRQITYAERYTVGLLRRQGLPAAAIATILGRHRSTISRELRRNASTSDGGYRPDVADRYARVRRATSRRNYQFTPAHWRRVRRLLRLRWSPEQIAGYLRRRRQLQISHETIYRYIWDDWWNGGPLHSYLRGARKRRRKRYGRYDSRGRLAGKRPITDRPASVETRRQRGHWEIDTVLGDGQATPCIVTLVERKTGYVVIGQLSNRTTAALNRRAIQLIRAQPHAVLTITADNGTEFHGYAAIERATGTRFFFATPHHAWERGTNENTNGLIRQYLPKGASMARLTQHQCNAIAQQLNRRPRKRLGFRTPEECYVPKR